MGSKPKPDKTSTPYLMKKLWKTVLRHNKKQILTAIAFMLLYAVCDAASIKFFEPVIDKIFIEKQPELLLPIAMILFALFALKSFGDYGQARTMGLIGFRTVRDLRQLLFSHIIKQDIAFFHKYNKGNLISRFTVDTNNISNSVSNALTRLGKDAVSVVLLIGLMFYQDYKLAAVIFIILPIAAYPIDRMSRKMRSSTKGMQEHMGGLNSFLFEVFQSIKIVKSYQAEDYESSRMKNKINEVFEKSYQSHRTKAMSMPTMDFLGGIAVSVVIAYGGYRVITGYITPGGFFTFIGALIAAARPIQGLGNLHVVIQEGLASLERLFAVLDEEPSISSENHSEELTVSKPDIEFKNVSFSYGGYDNDNDNDKNLNNNREATERAINSESQVLKNISLTIPHGQMTAIVGGSGAGKSTILNLILRFYEASAGEILIGGENIKNIKLDSLRENIALAAQDITLFNDTIYHNISCGNGNYNEDDIATASRLAAIHEHITNNLSTGYETESGESGSKLSGGQKQRIALARAFVKLMKSAPILLIDEVTSSLDTETAKIINDNLEQLKADKTIVAVTHSLATILKADKIYVIDNGRIVEVGTHEQLLQMKGKYAELYQQEIAAQQ